MAKLHTYGTRVTWTGNLGTGTSGYREFGRDHDVTAAGTAGSAGGPPPIPGSSDPAFRGDPARWNPEQLLVASLSQCHMLWYLHLCAVNGVVVVAYHDDASGTMAETSDGGQFTEVTLRPHVTVTDQNMRVRAAELHADAHRACFVANSVRFPVRHEPVIDVM